MVNRFFAFFLLILPLSVPALAGVPECDSLKGAARQVATGVLDSEYMYDCCDETISKCLAGSPGCRAVVEAAAAHVCRMAAGGSDRGSIVRSLEKRAMTVTGPIVPQVRALAPERHAGMVFGDEGAPVTVVMYVCARCPFCSKLVPALYSEVASGRMKGLARLVIRPFPIKSHPNSAEANQALSAAGSLGKGWPYILAAYRAFDSFSVSSIPATAAAAGLEPAAFAREFAAGSSRDALVASKKEGLAVGVESTPTLFLNGRRYQSELDVDTVAGVVRELASGRSQTGSLK
jgi:protein-disulfide isomerase